MLDAIQTEFSIRDLENLSGVKAHTIRIWEKRYDLLEPKRTDSNIRFYDLEGLRKLLNTSWLIQQGFKISKVAKMSASEMQLEVRDAVSRVESVDYVHNRLKLAMLAFDEVQFNAVIDQLEHEMTFREIFQKVFVKFLESVGFWWATEVIRPAHEHFISSLIRQKLYVQIDKATRLGDIDSDDVYVLFTPINEIHDLGLLYAHYELLLRGKRSIFLGQSVPVSDLCLVEKGASSHHYVCAATIKPEIDHVASFVYDLHEKLIGRKNDHLILFGPKVQSNSQLPELSQVSYFDTLSDFLKDL